jgi:hypothetical protein
VTHTLYRLEPGSAAANIEIAAFAKILPNGMQISEASDGIYLSMESQTEEDEKTQPLVERELDRLFFLTNNRVNAVICRRTVGTTLHCKYRVLTTIPVGKYPLNWTPDIELQLRLWSIASESNDLRLRVLFLFQIIELSYPDTRDPSSYPVYKSHLQPPHPRTEAKLLRHVVAHAGNARSETEMYLRFLDLPAKLSNLTHEYWSHTLESRISISELEARRILEVAV